MSKKWRRPSANNPSSRRFVYPNAWNGARSKLMQLIPEPSDVPTQVYTRNGHHLFHAILALLLINTVLAFFKSG